MLGPGQPHEIRHARLGAGLLDQGRDLAAVVGLVVEKMQQHMLKGKYVLSRVDNGSEAEIPGQRLLVQGPAEIEYFLVGSRALRAQLIEIGVQILGQDLYPDFDELRAQRARTDEEILDFSGSLDEAALARDFHFTTIVNPGEHVFPFRHVLLQFFNHQTHHRGQVTTLIKQAGHEPGVTDLMWLPGVEQ